MKRVSGAIVIFNQVRLESKFGLFASIDSWAIIELNFRRQIMRAKRRA